MDHWVIECGLLGGGILLLIMGGDVLVRGAVTLAARLGVSSLVIGLTIVAFGTSAPELALNVTAAIKGNPELAFGNVIGSNISNIGLILGFVAMCKPLHVNASVVRRELPYMIVFTLVTIAALLFGFGDYATLREPVGDWIQSYVGEWTPTGLARPESAVLLVLFLGFVYYTMRLARKLRDPKTAEVPFSELVGELGERDAQRSLPLASLLVLAGLAMLIGGGNLAETGAVGIARDLGMGEEVIGLTIVAIATSLPELATSLQAIRKGQVDMAVGNVVGSNIFNLGLVLGVTGMVSPIPLPPGGLLSLLVMLVLSVILVPMIITKQGVLSKVEGTALLLIYALFMFLTVRGALDARADAPPDGPAQTTSMLR